MKKFIQNFCPNVVLKLFNKCSLEIFSRYSSEIAPKVAKLMRKFSPSQLGIVSESDNIFRIRVVVSDLNSEFQIFFRGYSDNSDFFFFVVNLEYSDNSEFFSELIRSIRTIPNFFLEFRTDFRIICGKNMEIHQNPLFFHKNIFFLIRKSPNTPNSIFRANIGNLLLRVNIRGEISIIVVQAHSGRKRDICT